MKRLLACLGIGLFISQAIASVSADEITVAYPVPYVLYQRTTADSGLMRVRGTYRSAGPIGAVEARFAGGTWQVVDGQPNRGAFVGTITAPVGQGELQVRASTNPSLKVTVAHVSMGDLFLITGQSNADGRGDKQIVLDPANPYVGVKYRRNAWSKGDDPSANDGDYGSPWPMVLNDLIPEQKVPIGFIAAAVGSTVVQEWRKGGRMYERMHKMVAAATDGTMRIKAILYYQGENDITHYHTLSALGDYSRYKPHLTAAVNDFHADFSAPMLVGQITNLLPERARNDNVRRAQQEMWSELPFAKPGAVAYDILPSDGVHYRTEPNLREFARRWTLAIRAAVYGQADCACPKLERLTAVDARTLRLVFDQPLEIAKWDGTPGVKALGFRIVDDEPTLTDANVQETTLRGNEVLVKLDRPISAKARLSYGSGSDAQGQPTLKGAKNRLPVRLIFGQGLNRL